MLMTFADIEWEKDKVWEKAQKIIDEKDAVIAEKDAKLEKQSQLIAQLQEQLASK